VLNEPTISLRRKVLYEMPEDLQEAFTGTIDRIKRQPGSQPKQAMKILKWVYFAERPLNIKELRHAMAVNPGSVSYNLDFDALPSEESLLNCCLGLIVVDDRTFRVCLVHFALQEYFDVWHRVLFHAGHSDLAHSCLTYLSMDVFGVMAEQFERMGNAAWEGEWTYPAMYDFPFLTYAALNWGHHLRKQSDDSANELAISLLVGRVDYHCVTQVLGDKIVRSTSTGPGRIASLQFAGLHVAAFFGTSHVLHRLLNRPKQYADSKDRGGRTPLSYAAENGHQSVVKQLLCHAVNPNSRDAIYRRTPLSWASENGHQAVVQLLLEHCAVTSLNCSNGRAPISYAAAKGHKIVVQKLLDQNAAADSQRSTELPRKMRNKISFWWLNSTGFTAQTPLSLAAENGHKEIVQLLHSRGADADSRDNRGHSPVALAAQGGYEEIVQLLLDWGAESASRDYFGWTPLYHAAVRGHTKVVQLLLDLNVEVSLTDCSLKTPMHWASKNGHEAVVQMLLMRGIDANLRDLGGQSATSLAASGGHLAVVRILLEQNVDPDSKHIEGRTPLSFAAEGGYTEIVQLLLQRGADADSRDIRDLSPLSWAAGRGNDAVVQVLLEYDVDIDSIDVVEGRTPLSRAAEIGSQAIVSQLLQRNAMSDSKDKRGRSPLSWAARRRHESVVQLLLERGASSNSKDNDGWSPIHWAGGNKDDPVVQLLLHRSDATGINDCWNPTLPYVGPYTDGGEILGGVEFILIPGQPGQINRINRIVTQDS
jgi:ankyrin repeat protein